MGLIIYKPYERMVSTSPFNHLLVCIKGRAFGSPLTRVLFQRVSAAEVDPRAKLRAPTAVEEMEIEAMAW